MWTRMKNINYFKNAHFITTDYSDIKNNNHINNEVSGMW